jgi:hypothetical protein
MIVANRSAGPFRSAVSLVATLGWLTAATAGSPAEVPETFLSPEVLYVRVGVVERPGDDVLAWGRDALSRLDVAGLPVDERAARIAGFIHDQFAFTPDRLPDLSAFLDRRGGNCYAHARLGAFMLRLADVPARFVYEVHLEHKTPSASASARERGIGLFGQYHNDHFWVLWYDGERWLPFDSTLGIADYDDFIRVKIESPEGGVANPPFLLWREPAVPGDPMENVTAEFWDQVGVETLPRVPVTDWRALLETVGRLQVADLMHPISAAHEQAIARVARPFFGVEEHE